MSTTTNKQSRNFNLLADDKQLLRRRENEQLHVYLFVVVALVASWLLGVYQFSFFWVFIVIFLTFVVWKSKALSVMERFLRQCELHLHRRRVLSQHETAEWLNFVINRWYMLHMILKQTSLVNAHHSSSEVTLSHRALLISVSVIFS